MRRSLIIHATERDGIRGRVRESALPTVSEDCTLLRITHMRSGRAFRFPRRRSITGMLRAASRQILSFLSPL